MHFKFGQKIIDKIRKKDSFKYENGCRKRTEYHKIYGKIYYPYYNICVPLESNEYTIFNKDGNPMRTFFIRDIHINHAPSHPRHQSKYFIWDFYNFGLKTHFYTHKSMLETIGNPDKRYGILIESEAIVPEDYKIFEKNKGLENDFDMIFTYSADILEKINNAKFVPFCSSLFNGKYNTPDAHQNKTKDISILSSHKLMCDLHKFRYDLAFKCKTISKVDTYGTFDGGSFVTIDDTLKDYRYSFCIENDVKPYFFTERLICAFANQTIPIYLGASKIDEFFNPDGIIKINTKTDIDKIIKQCTKEEYERRLPAILDNYERAKKYINPFDYMYEHYFQ